LKALDFTKQELFRNDTQKFIPYLTLKTVHHNYADQPGNVFGETQIRIFYIHYKAGTALFLSNVKHQVMEFI